MRSSAGASALIPEGCEPLEPFVEAGVLRETELQVPALIGRTVPDTTYEVLLAAALCVRALQLGHVCIEPDRVAHTVVAEPDDGSPSADTPGGGAPGGGVDPVELPWPEPGHWASQLAASDAVAVCEVHDPAPTSAPRGDVILPLVFDGTRVYLERYWRHERKVGDALLAGVGTTPASTTPGPPDGTGWTDATDETGRTERTDATGGTDGTDRTDATDGTRGTAVAAVEPDREPERERSIDAVLDRYFGPATVPGPPESTGAGPRPGPGLGTANLQRLAAATALRHKVAIIAGGPGTGKTHTIARLLAAMHHLALDAGTTLEVALTAPTGKAAARMTEAVHQAVTLAQADDEVDLPAEVAAPLIATEASTIHRLLGSRGGIDFRHDRENPLPHDVVVVDETSMVDLPLMARLLDALGPDTRLVLVGDPFQLTSVEAGAVLGDVVGPAARSDAPERERGPLGDGIVVLRRVHRFGEDSAIAELAGAIRADDPEHTLAVLTRSDHPEVTWVDPADTCALDGLRAAVGEHARAVVRAARLGQSAEALGLGNRLKVLCGTRFGQLGSRAWTRDQESRLGDLVPRRAAGDLWYTGRPVIVTRNDYITGVFNGDTGVVIDEDDRHVVVMEGPGGVRRLAVPQLADVDTWWAMTIHKSQGSEFDHVVVSLPDATSPVLTNELLYTAVTRARQKVTLLATEAAIHTAVTRRIARASGLGVRLWP